MNNLTATFVPRLTHARSRSRGVGLIEVMIAMVILAVGFLALASLQTAATRSAAEARARTASVNFATDKLEELRSFVNRLRDANGDGTPDNIIDTNGDGLADALGRSFDQIAVGNDAPNEVGSGTVGYTFTRNWTAVPCDVALNGTVTCGGTITAATADFMRVAVRVRWNSADAGAAVQEVVIEDVISSSTPVDAAVAMSNPAIDRESPKVYIQPARIQSTIPIAIGDGLESAASDPQPTIIRDNVVRTQFEVLTFSTEADGDLLAERAFDYTVVGCECALEGVVSNKKSFEPTVWNGLTFSRPREVQNGVEHPDPNVEGNVSRVTARSLHRNNDPPVIKDLCTACCRDHHDTLVASTPKLDPTKPTADDPSTPDVNENQYLPNGNHRHFLPVLRGGNYTFEEATDAGDEYYETCRFLRRDGFYRLTLDAHLVDLQVFRNAELDEESETDQYADYARQFIDSYVNRAAASGSTYPIVSDSTMAAVYADAKVGLPTAFIDKLEPPTNFPLPEPGLQLLSRGVYIDYMTPEVISAIRCKINNTPDTPECLPYRSSEKLELVPFFAVGMTRLNSWEPSEPDVARMPLRDTRDPYSRGWAVPRSEGESDLSADAQITNIGLTNPLPGTELEQALSLTDSVPVEVGLVAELPPERVVVRFTINRDNDTFLDDPGVLLLSGTGVECLATGQHAGAFSWSCALGSNGRGTVIFSGYTGTECVLRDGGTCALTAPVANQLCFAPMPASVVPRTDTNLYRNVTNVSFDGSQAPNQEYAVDVIPADETCPDSDVPPGVLSSTPAEGATNVSSTTPLTVTFNEAVNTTSGAVTLSCNGGANLITGGTSGSGVTQLTLSTAAALPLGATCTLTVLAANVTDVDTIDPPNNMGGNYTATFVVTDVVTDTPPTVVGTPDRATIGQITITFSEPINATSGSVALSCAGSELSVTGGTGSNVSTLTVFYVAPLPSGASCTLTVLSANVTDVDAEDPPDFLDGNADGTEGGDYVHAFTAPIVDVAPTVTGAALAGSPTPNLNKGVNFVVTFSEAVTASAGWATVACVNPANGSNVRTINPNAASSTTVSPFTITIVNPNTGPNFPTGTVCTLSIVGNLISDVDTNDPPNIVESNSTFTFTRN